ncbi:hypothetical protein, partial [Escherichia coli]|uniref:hypothetical protein n=1 Tax=Escherichia coli TaxID=562 RepID=UPI001953B02D
MSLPISPASGIEPVPARIGLVLPSRRACLAAGAGLVWLAVAPGARATPAEMAEAIQHFTGGDAVAIGRVRLDI